MGAELRHHRAQQSLLQTSLHRECELRPQVSRPLQVLRLNWSEAAHPVFSGRVRSATECKELQLSEDQNPAAKPGHSFSSAQDHPRTTFRGKAARMKSKARAAPYPEVVCSGPWLLAFGLFFY